MVGQYIFIYRLHSAFDRNTLVESEGLELNKIEKITYNVNNHRQ